MKSQTKSRPSAEKKSRGEEIKVCGLYSCQRLAAASRDDVIRVYVTQKTLPLFGPLLKWCAKERRAYHVVTPAEMEKIAASTHHGEVCIIARKRPQPTWQEWQALHAKDPHVFALVLDDVSNPHNVGAIIRSAANFGISGILVVGVASVSLSSALYRTAEGGVESVPLVAVPDWKSLQAGLRKLKIPLYATHQDAKKRLFSTADASALPARIAVLLGNETKGISAAGKKAADELIAIPGTGAVESLNVSVAAAVFMAEYYRAHLNKVR